MNDMHDNSLIAYHTSIEQLSTRAFYIHGDLLRHGDGTAREIKDRMGFDDMNEVRPRLTELKKQLWVVESGNRVDDKTGKPVSVFRARDILERDRMIAEMNAAQPEFMF